MAKPKVRPGVMRVRAWPVLVECVEQGVALGYNRAHKHTDTPDAQTIKDRIEGAVTEIISERFDFPEDTT